MVETLLARGDRWRWGSSERGPGAAGAGQQVLQLQRVQQCLHSGSRGGGLVG